MEAQKAPGSQCLFKSGGYSAARSFPVFRCLSERTKRRPDTCLMLLLASLFLLVRHLLLEAMHLFLVANIFMAFYGCLVAAWLPHPYAPLPLMARARRSLFGVSSRPSGGDEKLQRSNQRQRRNAGRPPCGPTPGMHPSRPSEPPWEKKALVFSLTEWENHARPYQEPARGSGDLLTFEMALESSKTATCTTPTTIFNPSFFAVTTTKTRL